MGWLAGQNVLKLTYEDLLEDPMTKVSKVCKLLGVTAPHSLPQQPFEQQSSGDLRKALTADSWDSLYSAIKHTPRESDFHDVHNKQKPQEEVIVVPGMLPVSWEEDMSAKQRKAMMARKGVVARAGASGGDGLETLLKRNVPTAEMRVHTRRP